jgi:hypothetical protein
MAKSRSLTGRLRCYTSKAELATKSAASSAAKSEVDTLISAGSSTPGTSSGRLEGTRLSDLEVQREHAYGITRAEEEKERLERGRIRRADLDSICILPDDDADRWS